jgi:hypothetical protein
VISGFRRGVNEFWELLEFYAASSGNFLLKFRDNLSVPSTRVNQSAFLVQALRLCTGHTAHRGSSGIALPFLDQGTRSGWGVRVTHRPLITPGKNLVSIVQDAVWAPGPVWTGADNLAPPEFDLRTVQPVASRYTDRATRPNFYDYTLRKIPNYSKTRGWTYSIVNIAPYTGVCHNYKQQTQLTVM